MDVPHLIVPHHIVAKHKSEIDWEEKQAVYKAECRDASVWDGFLNRVITSPIIKTDYFAARMDTFEFRSHTIVPYLIFGDRMRADATEYERALEMLREFLSATCATLDDEDAVSVVQAMHGVFKPNMRCDARGSLLSWVSSLLKIYVAFIRLFSKSTSAFSLVHARYQYFVARLGFRTRFVSDLIATCSKRIASVESVLCRMVLGEVVLDRFTLRDTVKGSVLTQRECSTPSDGSAQPGACKPAEPHPYDDLVILLHLAEAASRVTSTRELSSVFNEPWLSVVMTESNLASSSPERIVTYNPTSFFLLDLADRLWRSLSVAYNDMPFAFMNCFPTNFVIAVDQGGAKSMTGVTPTGSGSEIHVHDWVMASAWPYFARCIAFGVKEVEDRRLVLPHSFPFNVLMAVVRYAYFDEYPLFDVEGSEPEQLRDDVDIRNDKRVQKCYRPPNVTKEAWASFFKSEFEEYTVGMKTTTYAAPAPLPTVNKEPASTHGAS